MSKTLDANEVFFGKTISSAIFDNDEIVLTFTDETKIKILDTDEQCCETRYLTLDDNIDELIGQKLVHIIEKEIKYQDNENDDRAHDICFLEIQGNKSSISFAAHNEHNGCYTGFKMKIKEMH